MTAYWLDTYYLEPYACPFSTKATAAACASNDIAALREEVADNMAEYGYLGWVLQGMQQAPEQFTMDQLVQDMRDAVSHVILLRGPSPFMLSRARAKNSVTLSKPGGS